VNPRPVIYKARVLPSQLQHLIPLNKNDIDKGVKDLSKAEVLNLLHHIEKATNACIFTCLCRAEENEFMKTKIS
jgi:hypothetical protein